MKSETEINRVRMSKSERKELRRKYQKIAKRQRFREHVGRIGRLHTRKLEEIYVLSRSCSQSFFENSIEEWNLTEDLSPKNLAIIDQTLSGNIEDLIRSIAQKEDREIKYPIHEMKMAAYTFIGIYLGDIICKNLGGKWELPGIIAYRGARIFQNGPLFFNRWFIILGDGKKIPVLKIARLRFDGSQKIKSLYEVYEKIRTTGDWK